MPFSPEMSHASLGLVMTLTALSTVGCGAGGEQVDRENGHVATSQCEEARSTGLRVVDYAGGRMVRVRTQFTGAPAWDTTLEYEGPRLVEIHQEIGGAPAFEVVLAYRSDGRVESASAYMMEGTSRGPEQGRLVYRYDDVGRLVRRDHVTNGAVTARCSIAYDTRGSISTLTCDRVPPEDGEPADVTTFQYDPAGRVMSYARDAETHTLTYDSQGRLASHTIEAFGEEDTTLFERDTAGRLLARRARGARDAISLEGEFPADFECGVGPPTPAGMPPSYVLDWLNAPL